MEEVIEMRVEINEIEKLKKINEAKSSFFKRINKVDKPLARMTEKKQTQITISSNERGDTAANLIELKRFQGNTMNNYRQTNQVTWMKMNRSLEKHKLPKLTQEEIENMNRLR